MNTQEVEEFLEHYGILGMKWGVRRSRAELDRAAGRRKEKGKPVTPTKRQQKREAKKAIRSPSEDASKAQDALKKAKKGGLESLDNQELQDLTRRLNLEQQYTRLTAKEKKPSAIRRGKEKVDFIVSLGETTNKAIAFSKSPAGNILKTKVLGMEPQETKPGADGKQRKKE
jgi:hypothetical protein